MTHQTRTLMGSPGSHRRVPFRTRDARDRRSRSSPMHRIDRLIGASGA
jgi:hypothetical protein